MVRAAKGYKCIIVMPQVPPMYERYVVCRKFGAQVHLTSMIAGDDVDFSKNAENFIGYTRQLVDSNPNYWSPLQFDTALTSYVEWLWQDGEGRSSQNTTANDRQLDRHMSLSPRNTAAVD